MSMFSFELCHCRQPWVAWNVISAPRQLYWAIISETCCMYRLLHHLNWLKVMSEQRFVLLYSIWSSVQGYSKSVMSTRTVFQLSVGNEEIQGHSKSRAPIMHTVPVED